MTSSEMTQALYERLFAVAGLPEVAGAISFGRVELPLADVSVPYETYGFLPALLPLWSGRGVKQTGVWMHWFSDRIPTCVEVSVEDENSVREIARTFEQLACDIVLKSIGEHGRLTSKAMAFGSRLGLNLDTMTQIEAVWRDEDEDRSGLAGNEWFRTNLPRDLIRGPGLIYSGDFPSIGGPWTERDLRRCSATEFSREDRLRLRGRLDVPPWLASTDQRPVFDALLEVRDHSGAWLSLNSPGWRYIDAKRALLQLASQVESADFKLLADAWSNVQHERLGGDPATASY